MLDMVLRSLVVMEDGMLRVAVRNLRFVGRQREILLLAVLGGLAVMARRLLVVIGRRRMVLRDVEGGVVGAGFIAAFDGAQSVPVGQQRLMRRMGVIFSDLIMPRRFAMKAGRLGVV